MTTVTGFNPPVRPLSNITPFTMRDGTTYLEYLEKLAQYVNETMGPEFAAEFNRVVGEFNDELAATEAVVSGKVAEFQQIHDAFMSDVDAAITEHATPIAKTVVDEYLATPGVYDAATAERVADTASQTRAALNAGYVGKGEPWVSSVNYLYVAPGGSDSNDGLSAATPFSTFQKAFDVLKLQGPMLQGRWEIVAAAGTYNYTGNQQTVETPSIKRVVVRGPAVGGHPNVPTAIINGAGGAAYKHGLSASGIGVRVEFRDLKFINFTAGAGDTTRIGCLGENESDVWFNNVHANGSSWTGIYAFNTVRSRVLGGILDACRSGYIANDTQSTISESIVKNCTESGVYWSRGSQGHVDYVTFDSNAIGLRVAENSRVDTVGNNFKKNSYGIRTQTGGVFGEGGAPNIFNVGTADANIQADIQYNAGSGDSKELETSQQYVRVGHDRTTRTHTGTVTRTTLSTPYTIPPKRLAGTGKQCRVHVLGILNSVGASGTFTINFGTMAVNFALPAAATNDTFEIDVTLLEVAGGYRAIGRISQGVGSQRMVTVGSGFNNAIAQDVTVQATLAATGDTLNIYRTDVYLMG